ncbi:MAG TPA: hypothetical protein VIJ35_13540, partial [Bradyrhizobium sp.]
NFGVSLSSKSFAVLKPDDGERPLVVNTNAQPSMRGIKANADFLDRHPSGQCAKHLALPARKFNLSIHKTLLL